MLSVSMLTMPAHVALDRGDMVLMVSDGVLEACSTDDIPFGNERLLRVVLDNRDLPAKQIVSKLHEAVRDYCGATGIQDDLTALIIKVESGG